MTSSNFCLTALAHTGGAESRVGLSSSEFDRALIWIHDRNLGIVAELYSSGSAGGAPTARMAIAGEGVRAATSVGTDDAPRSPAQLTTAWMPTNMPELLSRRHSCPDARSHVNSFSLGVNRETHIQQPTLDH